MTNYHSSAETSVIQWKWEWGKIEVDIHKTILTLSWFDRASSGGFYLLGQYWSVLISYHHQKLWFRRLLYNCGFLIKHLEGCDISGTPIWNCFPEFHGLTTTAKTPSLFDSDFHVYIKVSSFLLWDVYLLWL